MSYQIGQTVTLTLFITDRAGAAVDAATVAVYILPPGATVALGPFTPTRTGVGAYEYAYKPPHKGWYSHRWVTTVPDDAGEARFDVAPSQFVT